MTVVVGTGGYFSVYMIDGKIAENEMVVNALIAALREEDRHA